MPTLHHQLLGFIGGYPIIGLEYVTGESTISSLFNSVIDESKSRFAMPIVEEFHPLIHELTKACSISTAVDCLYYYPRFGFYNGLIDIFFLKDY